MEKKKGISLGVLIIIVILVFAIVIIVTIRHRKNTNSGIENATLQNTMVEQNTIKNMYNNVDDNSNSESYNQFIKGLKESLTNFNNMNSNSSEIADIPTNYRLAASNKYGITGLKLKTNGDLYLEFNPSSDIGKTSGTSIKVGQNAIKAGIMYLGNDLKIFAYMIDDKGKFYEFTLSNESNASFTFKENNSLKNIISIEQAQNSNKIFAIDINGKIYNIVRN